MEKLGVLKTTFEKINEVSRFEETRVFFLQACLTDYSSEL